MPTPLRSRSRPLAPPPSRASWRALVGLLCTLGLCACTSKVEWQPATQAIITVHSDLRGELASVEAVVFDPKGEKRGDSFVFQLGDSLSLPFSFTVVPSLPGTDQFLLTLSGRDGAGEALVTTQAIIGFIPGASVGVELWLRAGCKGRNCQQGQTCDVTGGDGSSDCVAIPVLTGRPIAPGQELDATFKPVGTDVVDVGPGDAAHSDAASGDTATPDADSPSDAAVVGMDSGDAGGMVGSACVGHPDVVVCVGSLLHTCNAQGESVRQDACPTARQCQLGVSLKTCAPCNPGTFRCSGTDLERCLNDGSRWSSFRTCASEALCNSVAGDCITGACNASTAVCMGDDLYGCSSDLTKLQLVASCDAGLCDPVNGACQACNPGSRSCAENVAETCDLQGKSLSRISCGGDQPKCNAGACVQCVALRDCPVPSNPCMEATCNSVSARCGTSPKAAHQACPSGVCNGSGSCLPCVDDTDCKTAGARKCLSTQCVACIKNEDCPATYQCDNNTCKKVSVAGTGTSCVSTAAATSATCGGYYCGVSRSTFAAAVDPSSVCGTDLPLVCNGTLSGVASSCTNTHALDADPETAIRKCVKETPSVQSSRATDACIACFVGVESCCTRNSNCLSTCLSVGVLTTQAQCDGEKQRAGCVNPLWSCSGLPNPL
jgi:hypothetical protein